MQHRSDESTSQRSFRYLFDEPAGVRRYQPQKGGSDRVAGTVIDAGTFWPRPPFDAGHPWIVVDEGNGDHIFVCADHKSLRQFFLKYRPLVGDCVDIRFSGRKPGRFGGFVYEARIASRAEVRS